MIILSSNSRVQWTGLAVLKEIVELWTGGL
jgi:hypothetical protein